MFQRFLKMSQAGFSIPLKYMAGDYSPPAIPGCADRRNLNIPTSQNQQPAAVLLTFGTA